MTKLFSACALAAFVFTSCQDRQPDHDSSIVPPASATTVTAPATVPENTAVTPVANQVTPTAQPGAQQIVNSVTSPTNMPKAITASAGLNPAHGQPNHRCDIAVGAPLNSAPASTAPPVTKTTTTTPQAVQVTPQTAPAGMASGKLNPPHGQPGHDCTIAVGQPLKS